MRLSARWLVPITVASVIAGGVAVSSAAAGRAPSVPDATLHQVLAAVAASDVTSLSGTVSARTDLGLPAAVAALARGGSGQASGQDGSGQDRSGPDRGEDSAATDPRALALRLATGENTVRVFVDGPQRVRLQLIDPFAQLDVVRNRRDLWTYASSEDAVTHTVLPERGDAAPPADTPQLPTPAALADRLIAAADPTTEIALGEPRTVAGRATYTVVVTPRTRDTLVEQVVVAVDAATGVPLRVQVRSRVQAEPAVEVGFTDVDFARPDASLFDFAPPPGATVTETSLPERPAGGTSPPSWPGALSGLPAPDVLGQGWAAVVRLDGVDLTAAGPALTALTTPVDGGRVLRTALLTVLVTDDGRVLAGAVPLDVLRAAA